LIEKAFEAIKEANKMVLNDLLN